MLRCEIVGLAYFLMIHTIFNGSSQFSITRIMLMHILTKKVVLRVMPNGVLPNGIMPNRVEPF